MLILRRKPSTIDPIERIHALNPRHPLMVRQANEHAPFFVWDMRLGQVVGRPFTAYHQAEAFMLALLERMGL